MNNNSKKTVHVVGAGFSGLTVAYYLLKLGFEVEIFERAKFVGGIIQTVKTPYGIVETGANAFLNSPELENLCKDIDLQLLQAKPESGSRFIFRNAPQRVPVLWSEAGSLLKFLFQFIFARKTLSPRNLESIRSWGARTLSQTLSFYTLETALQGIYAGAPSRLSASLILKNVFLPKSKTKYKKGSVSPAGGMGEFNEKIFQYLNSNGVKFNFQNDYRYKASGIPVVFALPAYEVAKILEKDEPVAAETLKQIEYLSVITANLFFKDDIQHLKGFGCLFPPEENNLILGVLFNQCIFAKRVKDSISENWILGGARVQNKKNFLALSDHEITTIVLKKRAELLGIQNQDFMPEILLAKITRWDRAFPHYTIELEKILEKLKPLSKNIFLHGNYLGQLGLTKLLGQSEMTAKNVLEGLK